jgi:hypothetical protein
MLLLMPKYFPSTFAGCNAVLERLHMRPREVHCHNLFLSHSSTDLVIWRKGTQGWTSLPRKQAFVTCILGLHSNISLATKYHSYVKYLVFHPTDLYYVFWLSVVYKHKINSQVFICELYIAAFAGHTVMLLW